MSTSDLPAPPRPPSRNGGAASRRAPRQRSLTREAILDAAMAIVDSEGLDALTMRAVAQALGTGAASLYAHVGSKDELLELLVERVIGEMPFGDKPDPSRWIEQLKTAGLEMRRVWARHRDLARASFARIPLGENGLEGSEWMISVMRAGGLSDRAIGLGTDLLALYIGAVSYEESLESVGGSTPEAMAEFVANLRGYLASLPVDRFPGLVSMAAALTEGNGDERFDFGLEVLIRGLISISGDRNG
jgi:AcrR family transcriptional regulator